jgi:hypothetical protein
MILLMLDFFVWLERYFLYGLYRLLRKFFLFLVGLYKQAEGEGFLMTEPYMTLEKTNERFPDRTFKLILKIFDANDREQKRWTVCSGQGYAQNFRKAGRNIPGSMEPCPQGTYVVHDIAWAGGKDNWDVSHGSGLGPVFVPVVCPDEKRRGEFGIHADYNRNSAPGSAGCIVTTTLGDMKDIVVWLRKLDPKILKVDWGL